MQEDTSSNVYIFRTYICSLNIYLINVPMHSFTNVMSQRSELNRLAPQTK